MQNVTNFPSNSSSHSRLPVVIKVCMVIPVFSIFLYCIAVMLRVFACHRRYLDSSRYILFAHMLINDTLQLLSSVLLFLLVMGLVKSAIVFCVPLLFISTVTYQNTPLILATMSLERYVAIFYPLQCPAAWRSDRIWIIIMSLWLLSCMVVVINASIGEPNPALASPLTTPVLCLPILLNLSPIQILFNAAKSIFFFAAVAVIILFTYMRILIETRKLRQDSVSVSKAMHTVLLHGCQLLLSMLAFSIPITETLIVMHAKWPPEDIAFFNYFCFILTPRLLSPLIYGFRDQSLRGYIGKAFLCCLK
ncbi:odorant receptor 131-2-like [Nelusetta ayraudi]|uniref:odorant receptor 131-2-like n=1 Tax=Nelusetta ayraudi TaxID=303726 RepID=UPI003F6EDC54